MDSMAPSVAAELHNGELMLTRWEQGYELHVDELVALVSGLCEALREAKRLANEVEPFPTPAVVRLCRYLQSADDDSSLAR